MRKNALMILVITSGAILLLIGAAARSHDTARHPDPYLALSWIAALIALGVFAVMLAEYFIHRRSIHLFMGGAFLAMGIMGMWDAVTFPYQYVFKSAEAHQDAEWAYLALWQSQWVTLAIMLLYCMIRNKKLSRRSKVVGPVVAVTAISVLWAAVLIFAAAEGFQLISGKPWLAKANMITSISCGLVFLAGWFFFSRVSIMKHNSVLAWMAYGLIFGALGQIAMIMRAEPDGVSFWFANLMKAIVFITPLAGLLAEHTRLQSKLNDQASEMKSVLRMQQAVGSSESSAELYKRIVDHASNSFDTMALCIMPYEKERGLLKVGSQIGFDYQTSKQLIFRPGEGSPGDCFSDKELILVRDITEDQVLQQKLYGVKDVKSALFSPLIVRNECLGALALFFDSHSAHKLSKEDLRLLDLISNQAALAVEVIQLRDSILDRSKISHDYAHELELVWDISKAVASKLELNQLVDTLAEKLRVAVNATTCSVLVFESDLVGLKILGYQRLSRHQSVADHIDQCDAIAAKVAQGDEPLVANDVPNSCHCKYPEMALEDGGVHHMLAVPMSLRGFTGAISVFRQNAEPFGEKEKRLLMRLAPVAAAGIRNAEIYEREKNIAERLQQSLLPEPKNDYGNIQVASGYQAAFDESLVGGDFFEIIEFGGGKYGIAIGDVAGKGLDAAAYTAMARYMIKAFSTENPDPVYVISRLNNALYRHTPSGQFITLIYGVADSSLRTFTYANAGHEIPFLYRAESEMIDMLTTTGPAAGALADSEYHSETIPFDPGDTLIFYTDGATEVRRDGKFLGTEGLQEIIADLMAKSPQNIPEGILQGIREYAKNGRLKDDVAILTVKAKVPGALF